MTIDIANSNLNLKSLTFWGPELHLESLKILGSRMKNLRVFKLKWLLIADIQLVVIADSMPSLEDLDISYPDVAVQDDLTDSGIEVLSSKLKGLRKINISGNNFITDKSLVTLSMNCVYLTEIIVHDCRFVTSYGIAFVMHNSSNLSSLLINRIEFGLFDDSSCCARKLSTIDISDSVIPDEFLHLLVKADIPLKRITGTDLLTDEKISDLSQCLCALVLIDLDLCYNLTESTLFTLAKNCRLLEDISMEGTNLGGGEGDGVTNIVKNPRIKSLNFKNNWNLSDECLAKLASVCPSLEVLDVSSCHGITENGISDSLKSASKIRKLQINKCRGIKNIGNGFELSELVVLGAARSGINGDGLVVIGNRCCWLLNLNLDGCLGVTTVGLKAILTNCKRLRELSFTGCPNVSMETVDWLVFSRPSLRKIILPHSSLPSKNQSELFLRHGCLVATMSEEAGVEPVVIEKITWVWMERMMMKQKGIHQKAYMREPLPSLAAPV
ncbi:F-box/LRR-repeat protein 4-like [Rhododendron vialii]|uniref:F-box/LRR-repeat protein 4-like n=1 Tax=Rhododendron vialii TaxID=182163 RepID=UPI00265E2329|nr:F-box/LRR-repeat protein 4-like [Rhododendron vialii]